MSRPHGRARVSPRNPVAFAICERCGFLYNHTDLSYQFDWRGTRLQNLRIQVCQSCTDKPFEHNRVIILPPDPIPIANPSPEFNVSNNNPLSLPGPNWDPLRLLPISGLSSLVTRNGNIGNLTGGAGVDAAFSGIVDYSTTLLPASSLPAYGGYTLGPSKRSYNGALRVPSLNGLLNYIGQNWAAQPGAGFAQTSSLTYQVATVSLAGFTMQAPADMAFRSGGGAIALELDGWLSSGAWTPLWTGNTAGTVGETLSVTLSDSAGGFYFGHRIVLTGDGTHAIGVASLAFKAAADQVLSAPPITLPS
jgi:hypothetical protein